MAMTFLPSTKTGMVRKDTPRLRHIRNRYLFFLDVALFTSSVLIAYALRFEGLDWPPEYQRTVIAYLVLSLPVKLVVLWLVGVYRRLWRYAGILEVERLILGAIISGVVCLVLGAVILPASGLTAVRVPIAVLVLDDLLTAAFATGPRIAVRAVSRGRYRALRSGRRVLIVGAGAAGEMIVKELLGHPQLGLNPIGFVDDDRSKHGHRLNNLPVLGPVSKIKSIVLQHWIEEIVIAMPRARGGVVREVVRAAVAAGVPTRTVPGIYEILSGRVAIASLRRVEIQDLLRRDPIQTNLEQVRSLATGETVLVTGAGGSIGSELCRQLALLDPAEIVLLGHGENSIFDVLAELTERFPSVTAIPIITDVRDRDRLRQVFSQYRPYAVFHAAAHKHVPLMEGNVAEAVTNNVLGTKNVAELSAEFG